MKPIPKEVVHYYISQQLADRVSELARNQRVILAPFPVDRTELYWWAWPDGDRARVERLFAGYPQMMYLSNVANLVMSYSEGGATQRHVMYINLPKRMPTPSPADGALIQIERLPAHLQASLFEWYNRWFPMYREGVALCEAVRSMTVCNTYGQLHRLWPDLFSLLDTQAHQRIGHAKQRSAYPEKALDDSGNLAPQYAPDALAVHTATLAGYLMLPELDKEDCTEHVTFRYVER